MNITEETIVKSYPKIALNVLITLLFSLMIYTPLFAAESLKTPLIDISGWEAEPAMEMEMNINGVKMLNATRSYEKGDNTIDAAIMVTSQQMGMASFQGMNMSSGGIKIESSEMDGLKIMHTHDSNENEGNIMVLLGETETNSAIFSLGYSGISGKESMAILKQYNLKQIQNATNALMK